jgi:hypothetical protein
LPRPRTRAEHVRTNCVIVAARIRLMAALKTATHHVGGRSVVIDERLPDNHQAAEGPIRATRASGIVCDNRPATTQPAAPAPMTT